MRTDTNDTLELLRVAPFALALLGLRPSAQDGVRRYLAGVLTGPLLDELDAVLARDTTKIALAYPMVLVLVELGISGAGDAQHWLAAGESSASLARDRSTIEDVVLGMYRHRALPAADPLASDELFYLSAQAMDRALWYLAARCWIAGADCHPAAAVTLMNAALRARDAELVAKLTCVGVQRPGAQDVLRAAMRDARTPSSPLFTLASIVAAQNAEQKLEHVA